MRPLVSVLIINYNYGRYLPEAVESVLGQDFPHGSMEIIVVDDGSTDDSSARIQPYLGRVQWISQQHVGQVSAFNAGVQKASGEWIALLESDDLWEKNKLQKVFKRIAQEPQSIMIQHWLLQVDAKNNPIPGYSYPSQPLQFDLQDVIQGAIPYAGTSCLVFHAQRIRPFLPLPESMLFGADICLRWIATTLGPILNIPETLGRRRLHGKNLFGETLYDDPEKLKKALPLHSALGLYCIEFLRRQGITAPPSFIQQHEIERLQMELFFHRYQLELGSAIRAWGRILRACGGRPYAFFKGLTLLLALLYPPFYLRTHRFYAQTTALRRWRQTLLPLTRARGQGKIGSENK